jgi:hypothetical protein
VTESKFENWHEAIEKTANGFFVDNDFLFLASEVTAKSKEADLPFKRDALPMIAIAISQILLHNTMPTMEELHKKAQKVRHSKNSSFIQVLSQCVTPSELEQLSEMAVTSFKVFRALV